MDLDAEAVHERSPAAHLFQALGRVGGLDVAHLSKAGGLTGFRLEPRDQVAAVGVELALPFAAQNRRNDLTGRVPGGARGQLVAFQHDHIGHSQLGQVVGEVAADRPAADDHGLGMAGQRLAHGLRVSVVLSG